MTLWRPIDDVVAAVATLCGDTTDHQRVRDASAELDAAARQTVAAALLARKLTTRRLPHLDWPVARLAGRNALEWRDKGYPSGGTGGARSGERRDLGDVIVRPDDAALLWWRAHQTAVVVRAEVAKLNRGAPPRHACHEAWKAIATLHDVMLEAAGLSGAPAPIDLNRPVDELCWNHWQYKLVEPWEVRHAERNVCRWCRDQHLGWGEWPPENVVADHDRGGKKAATDWHRTRELAAAADGVVVNARRPKVKKPAALVDAQGRTGRGAYAEVLNSATAT